MTQEITTIRVRLDGLSRLTKELNPTKTREFGLIYSIELAKCTNAILLGKAWLGKCLGALGTPTPYPKDGERHTVEDIEKTADTFDAVEAPNWGDNHIEKVDWLRQQIGEILKEEYITSAGYVPTTRFEAIARTNVYSHLCEARFWLGFELERIKNLSLKDAKETGGKAV